MQLLPKAIVAGDKAPSSEFHGSWALEPVKLLLGSARLEALLILRLRKMSVSELFHQKAHGSGTVVPPIEMIASRMTVFSELAKTD